MFYEDDTEDYDDEPKELKCWSCDKWMSYSQRSENDGCCPHCNNEIELDD